MLRPLAILLSIFSAALKRMRANLGLTLSAEVALIAAVALAVSIPVYADGASLRLLRDEIARQERQTARSPFALLFRYVGAWNGPLEWERVASADTYISGEGLQSLGLRQDSFARHVRTDQLQLFGAQNGEAGGFLRTISLGFISGLDAQIQIVDGAAPAAGPPGAGAPIEVLVARALADQVGINVGDTFTLVATGARPASLPIRVSGLWQPANAADPAWFFTPDTLSDVFLTSEASFTGAVAPALRGEVGQVLWYARLSGARLSATQADPLLNRIEAVGARAAARVPGLRREASPAAALARYHEASAALTLQMAVFSLPIVGLVIYFVAMVAGLLVDRQRAEIALLKTRGVRDLQILGIALVEWLVLGALAMLIGPWLGLRFAALMGRTTSFLELDQAVEPLAVALTPAHLRFGLAAVALSLIAALLPSAVAARRTLVDEQQQLARQVRAPLWQRLYLDVALLIPPVYGIYQLQRGGGLQVGTLRGADPFSNPLLMLVPLMLCFALALLTARVIPAAFELLARLARQPGWVTPLVSLRSLARQPGAYRGALLLLVLTLSMATYSASMAATIEGALEQAITYQVGAPTRLIETGQRARPQIRPGEPAPQPGAEGAPGQPRYLFVPVSEHLQVPGILAATRVGSYDATVQTGANTGVQLIGIDRVDFPKVIPLFKRSWGDGQSLGGLMNMLARNADGVLVSRNAIANGLSVGDRVPLQVEIDGDRRTVPFRIIGIVDLWPGFYPQERPLFIANLDYIFDQMSSQYLYDVWVARDSSADLDQIVSGVRARGISVVDRVDARELLVAEQTRPQRQGVFGMLSVGFITAGSLTLLGFLISSIITARRRVVELGVLRALGLRGWQVRVALAIELALVVLGGIGAGTAIGVLAAVLVVPLLQIGAGPFPGTPPYPSQVAWDQVATIYAVFAGTMGLALLVLGLAIGRLQLFQAVKLGDAN
jgi:putative ABC transport system permease protein